MINQAAFSTSLYLFHDFWGLVHFWKRLQSVLENEKQLNNYFMLRIRSTDSDLFLSYFASMISYLEIILQIILVKYDFSYFIILRSTIFHTSDFGEVWFFRSEVWFLKKNTLRQNLKYEKSYFANIWSMIFRTSHISEVWLIILQNHTSKYDL